MGSQPEEARVAETKLAGTKVAGATTALPGDGTRELLQWGGAILGSGLLALLLLLTLLGGFSATGASTNTGWFALIITLGCIPFGGLLLGLGVAKWFRRRRMARERQS
jgi:hypothetical protein